MPVLSSLYLVALETGFSHIGFNGMLTIFFSAGEKEGSTELSLAQEYSLLLAFYFFDRSI